MGTHIALEVGCERVNAILHLPHRIMAGAIMNCGIEIAKERLLEGRVGEIKVIVASKVPIRFESAV